MRSQTRRWAPQGTLLESLPQTVRRSRRRWLLRRSLTGLALAAAAMSPIAALTVGLVVLEVVSLGQTVVSWGVALAALLAATVALLLAWRSSPDEAAMIRFIDDQVGLESRLVTAFELERRPPANPVAKLLHLALLRDLERLAPAVNVRRLLPLRFLPVHAAAVAIVLGSVVAANVIDYWRPSGQLAGAADTNATSWGEAERNRVAAELDLLAEALEEEAKSSGDEYTRALAEHARALARDLQESGGDGMAAQAGVSNLLSHIERALGSRFASGASSADVEEASGSNQEATFPEGSGVPVMGLSVPMSPAARALAGDVQEIRERLEMVQAQRIQNPYFGGSYQVTPGNSPADVKEAGLIGEPGSEAAGAPVGAAQRSTDAAGDAAGGGSQELDVGQLAGASDFAEAEDVSLPQAAGGRGARVQASAELGAESGDTASVIGRNDGSDRALATGLAEAVTVVDSIRRDAGDWRREPLGPHARLVAQRLFEPEDLETRE